MEFHPTKQKLSVVSRNVFHDTPPKFHSSPLKNGGWETRFLWKGNLLEAM